MSGPYDDIIALPHHVSLTHRPMPREDRAAQFAPFSALTGYEMAIRETGRLTDRQVQLDADEIASLNDTLCCIQARLAQRPAVTATYFVPDEKKSGGAYITVEGTVKRLDELEKTIIFEDGTQIPMDAILHLSVDEREPDIHG
jgi:hypothetical protein